MSKDGGEEQQQGTGLGGGDIYKPRDTIGIMGRIGECPSCSCR